MADFTQYAPLLKECEGYGNFTDDPSDRGGATMSGVTLSAFRAFFGKDKGIADLRSMTERQWSQIMKAGYWDKLRADDYRNQSVAEICADWCVNSGPGIAKKVQALVGANPDGDIGPQSLALINGSDQRSLFNRIKDARVEYYNRLAAIDRTQERFLRGWLNRLEKFHFNQ